MQSDTGNYVEFSLTFKFLIVNILTIIIVLFYFL